MSSPSDVPSPAAPQTVLVVEDYDDLRRLFREALRYAGFTVIDVADGPAALHVLENVKPDVVVLDLRLPTLDGYSVREELAAHADTRDLPVVVVTAGDVNYGRLRPARVLRKPVDVSELVAVVRNCIATKWGTRPRSDQPSRR